MATIDISEVGPKLKMLLSESHPGGEVVISDAGKPIARIVLPATRSTPEFGYFKGEVWMAEDFDELPADELAEWEK